MTIAKRGTSKLVPKLRFPEFRKAPEWKVNKLSALIELVSGMHLSPDQYSSSGVAPYFTGPSDFTNNMERVTKWAACSTNTAKKHDTLITVKGSGVGECWYVQLPSVAMGRQLMAVRAKESSSQFIHQFLLTKRARFEDLAAGNLIPGLARGDILDLAAAFPKIEEQQRVADCLTSLDEVIAAQGRKVEALKAHKRGLMQQLFPREGETFPRLRFPEFHDAPEWEQKAGGVLFENRKEGGEEGLPIYSVTVNDGMIPRASFDRDFYDIADPEKNKKACKGDIAYNMMRMWQGAQGVAVEDCMVSPAYVVLSPLEGVCSSFFAYLFKLPQSLELLAAYSRGLTKDRLRLYFDDFARMPLCAPGREEQQRIADCLSSLDAQITAESSQLAALKTHKQGLLQQLFPAPEAASA